MRRVIIAGGSCGSSMLQGAENIKEVCAAKNVRVQVSTLNLWQSTTVDLRANLVVQMFPFFKQLHCPILNGRPFIDGCGVHELLDQIINVLIQVGDDGNLLGSCGNNSLRPQG